MWKGVWGDLPTTIPYSIPFYLAVTFPKQDRASISSHSLSSCFHVAECIIPSPPSILQYCSTILPIVHDAASLAGTASPQNLSSRHSRPTVGLLLNPALLFNLSFFRPLLPVLL